MLFGELDVVQMILCYNLLRQLNLKSFGILELAITV